MEIKVWMIGFKLVVSNRVVTQLQTTDLTARLGLLSQQAASQQIMNLINAIKFELQFESTNFNPRERHGSQF